MGRPFKPKERDATIGPHIPMQWPKPTVNPVEKMIKYRARVVSLPFTDTLVQPVAAVPEPKVAKN